MDIEVSAGSPAGAPLADDLALHNNPTNATAPAAEPAPAPKAEPAKPLSASDAIKQAQAKVSEDDAKGGKEPAKAPEGKEAPKVEPKPAPVAKEPAPNAAEIDGKAPASAAKPLEASDPHREAPTRFRDDAKGEWANAPASVRAEVHRMQTELEQGHAKYKADAEAFEPVRKYHEMAKQGGTDLQTALTKYTGMEEMLRKSPIQGLHMVMENLGLKKQDGTNVTLRDVAHMVLSQSPEEQTQGTVQALQGELAELKKQLADIPQQIKQQNEQQRQADALQNQVAEFAAKPENSRFEELAETIHRLITTGMAQTLPEAYQMADRLTPAPAIAKNDDTPVTPAPKALKPNGQKSISGAPSSGTSGNGKPKVLSTKDALKAALAQHGA